MASFIVFLTTKKSAYCLYNLGHLFQEAIFILKEANFHNFIVHPYVYVYVVWQQIVKRRNLNRTKKAIRSDF